MTPFPPPDAALIDSMNGKNGTNGNGKNTAAWIVIGLAVLGAMGTPFGLLYNNQSTQGEELRRLRDKRETDLNVIAEGQSKLAAIDKQFAEVETQFHAFKERMLENEAYTKERADTNHGDIVANAERIRVLAEAVARLEERQKLKP